MGATPRFKVYDAEGKYIASFKYVEDAAILVAAKEDGTTIRTAHNIGSVVWLEGKDGHAGTSYSVVADIVHSRL